MKSSGTSVEGEDAPPQESAEQRDGEAVPPEPLSLDVIFDMLKNERRREVLDYMRQGEDPFTLREIAEHIAALENGKDVSALNSTERKRVYVGLYQCHFPRMDDAGVIDFDRNRGTVLTGPNTERLYPYLDMDGENVDEGTVYAKIALLFAGGLIAGSLVPMEHLTAVVALALLGVVAGYALSDRLPDVQLPEMEVRPSRLFHGHKRPGQSDQD